jgi:hypothetical protein
MLWRKEKYPLFLGIERKRKKLNQEVAEVRLCRAFNSS